MHPHPNPTGGAPAPFALRAAIATALLVLAAAPGAQTCSPRTPTAATDLGPHDFSSAPGDHRLWRDGDPGEALLLDMRVVDTCGKPVSGALMRLLHAGPDGSHHPDRWRAHLRSDERGQIRVITAYPGHAGYFARHIHFIITRPGHRELITRLFFRNDPAVEANELEELAVVLEKVRVGDESRWAGGFEFVLAPAE